MALTKVIGEGVGTLTGNADFNGDLDVDGTTNLDAVDIDGAVDMASTLTVGGNTTLNGKFLIDGSNNDLMTFRTTGDTASQVLGLQFQNNSEAVTAQIFGTGDNSSSGVFRIKGIGDVAIIGGDIGVSGAAGDLVVKSGGDVHVGTGDLIFATSGKGIVLGATSNTAANTLDNYEEGTFNITIRDNTSGGNTGSVTQTNKYVKIGNKVWMQFNLINITTTGMTGSNVLYLTGLPFTPTSGSYGSGSVLTNQVNVGADCFGLSLFQNESQSFASLIQNKDNVGSESAVVSAFDNSTADVFGTMMIEV